MKKDIIKQKNDKQELRPAIVFDVLPRPFEDPISVKNIYTSLINNMYGENIPENMDEFSAILNTIGYTFENRVHYLINSVLHTTVARAMPIFETDDNKVYNTIFQEIYDRIYSGFDGTVSTLNNYVQNTVNPSTLMHIIASMGTDVNNVIVDHLNIFHNGNIDKDIYDLIVIINRQFTLDMSDVFATILTEFELVYYPQYETCVNYFKSLENAVDKLTDYIIEGEHGPIKISEF